MSKTDSERLAPASRKVFKTMGATMTAHYVVNGRPLCADVTLRNGQPAFASFLCNWGPLRAHDRKCHLCTAEVQARAASEEHGPANL